MRPEKAKGKTSKKAASTRVQPQPIQGKQSAKETPQIAQKSPIVAETKSGTKPASKGKRTPSAAASKKASAPKTKAPEAATAKEVTEVGAKPAPSRKISAAKKAETAKGALPEKKPSKSKPAAKEAATAPSGKRRLTGAAAKAKERRLAKALTIPPILLEGDAPSGAHPRPGGPGTRYAISPEAPRPVVPPTSKDLPEAYGSGRVFVSARDPHWLYCTWDMTREQQTAHNERSHDGHLILRVHSDEAESQPVIPDIHVHPESRSWFIYVPKAETRYSVELGFFEKDMQWRLISRSGRVLTPPEAPSTDLSTEFATIPAKIAFKELAETVQEFAGDSRPLLEAAALAQEHASTSPKAEPLALHEEKGPTTPANTISPGPASEAVQPTRKSRKKTAEAVIQITEAPPSDPEVLQQILQLLRVDEQRRIWMGSLEITELLQERLQAQAESISAAELAKAGGEAPAAGVNISSPMGGELPPQRKFWFNVNAELVIYGATDPEAKVRIGERPIKLRPDGSFSFRFALPDGRYHLPIQAESKDGLETREAQLAFGRDTAYRGQVEAHPQEESLKAPAPENIP